MEYQYSDCENNQEYLGSSIPESNNLTQCPINTCEDRSTEVFRHNNVHMSNVAEVQLTTNSNLYGVPEGRANVGSKISFSNQRILEDLSHSKPLYLTRANEINVQKSNAKKISTILYPPKRQKLMIWLKFCLGVK